MNDDLFIFDDVCTPPADNARNVSLYVGNAFGRVIKDRGEYFSDSGVRVTWERGAFGTEGTFYSVHTWPDRK